MSQMPPAAAAIAHPSQNNRHTQPTEDGVAAETRRGAQISIANKRDSGLKTSSQREEGMCQKFQRECVRRRMRPQTCVNHVHPSGSSLILSTLRPFFLDFFEDNSFSLMAEITCQQALGLGIPKESHDWWMRRPGFNLVVQQRNGALFCLESKNTRAAGRR